MSPNKARIRIKKIAAIAAISLFAVLFFLKPAIARPAKNTGKMNAYQVIRVVTDAARLLEEKGEAAFPEFKKEVKRWKRDEAYIFVVDMDGNMIIHPDPKLEGNNQIDLKDSIGRPIIRMFISETMTAGNDGWVHYLWVKPGDSIPTWKSSYLKRVKAPSGRIYIVGCGIHKMKMEKEFIVGVVNEAAKLVAKEGAGAFGVLRDKTGPFVYFDTYVFVDTPDGVELVNAAFPEMEGKNIIDLKDTSGKYLVREYIDIALKNGAGWVNYLWPRPGQAAMSKKHTYVKKVTYGGKTFIVGSGAYLE